MKIKILLFLITWLLYLNPLKAQSTNVLAEEQVKLVLKFQEAAWNRGDIEAYMKSYWKSDSLLFIGSKGPTYGYLKTLTNYKLAYPDQERMGKLSFELIKLTIIDQHAMVSGKWQLNRKDDTPKGFFTLLLRQIKGNWKIVYDHSSSSD